MNHAITRILLSLALLLSQSNSFAQSALTFKQAWIAEAPPVSKVLAAYMAIENNTDKPIIIESMSSDDFSKVEFHRTTYENDMAKMRHLDSLTVPADGQLVLEQGSYHVMLFNPARKLRSGDTAKFIVKTSNKKNYTIDVTVKKSNSMHQHHHH